jgi:hypothetical protein
MKAIFRRGHADHNTKQQKHASTVPSHTLSHVTHPAHASSPPLSPVATTTTTTTSTTTSQPPPPGAVRNLNHASDPLGGAAFANFKPQGPVFGVALTEVAEREGRDLPAIAELSMAYLDRYGMRDAQRCDACRQLLTTECCVLYRLEGRRNLSYSWQHDQCR